MSDRIINLDQDINVSQFGWSTVKASDVNLLQQYIDSILETVEELKEVNTTVEQIQNMFSIISNYYNQIVTSVSMVTEMKDTVTELHREVITAMNFTLAATNITKGYSEQAESSNINAALHKDEAEAAKVSAQQALRYIESLVTQFETTYAAFLVKYQEMLDLYDVLLRQQVYRGSWNPNTGAYPPHKDTNSIWDVVLNTGQPTFEFNNITWRSGDRLLYVLDTNEYQHIEAALAVTSINGRTGAVTLTEADIGLDVEVGLGKVLRDDGTAIGLISDRITGISSRLDNFIGSEYTLPPYPDVWIPFNDSLRMHAGYGDEIKVGDYVVANQASFSRASTATYIDKSGVLRTAAINEPRFEKEGLLIEGQSTNIVPNSSTFATLSVNGLTYIDSTFGSIPTRIFTHNLAGLAGINYNPHATTANNHIGGTTYTASCIVKLVSGSGVRLRLRASKSDGSFLGGVVFSLDLMSQTTSDASMGSASSGYKSLGNGYYKVWITATPSESGAVIHWNLLADAETAGVVEFGAAQIEALPFASSYIPTNGAAATRAADVCSLPFDGNYTETGFTITSEADTYQTSTCTISSFSFYNKFNLTSDSSTFVSGKGGDYRSTWCKRTNGNGPGVFSCRLTKEKEMTVCANGVLGGTVTSTSVIDGLTAFRLGSIANSQPAPLWGHIRNFRIWHRALTDAQLKSLS